jgi:hypothetical protein
MKNKTKVNTEKLNEWISPTREILKPKLNQVPNSVHKGDTIMTEEEFDAIMNDI